MDVCVRFSGIEQCHSKYETTEIGSKHSGNKRFGNRKKRKDKNETTNHMNKTNKWQQQQQHIMACVSFTKTTNTY